MVDGTPDIFDSRNLDLDEKDEKAFYEDLEDNADEHPKYGVTCVRESAFTEYTEDFAKDVGYWPPSGLTYKELNGWPYTYLTINWEEAAEALKEDYYETTFRGETYYCR
jgi:hypothetical protein